MKLLTIPYLRLRILDRIMHYLIIHNISMMYTHKNVFIFDSSFVIAI